MKHLWLLLTATGLFLFLGSAGALETETISLLPLLLQIAAGGVLLFLGQRLRKTAEARARAARRKAAALQKKAGVQASAQPQNRSCHRVA